MNNWPNTPVKSIRLWDCGVTWKNIHIARGTFYFQRLDQIVALAESKGVEHITLVLGMTPKWAARNPNSEHYAPWLGEGSNSAPHTMSDWTDYVRAVAKRYKGRIHAYQIWNEPGLRDFWEKNEYSVLAHMARLAYEEIKQIDNCADVVAPAILPRPSSGGMRRSRKVWRAFKKEDWPFDVLSFHAYPEQGKGPGRINIFTKRVKRNMRRLRSPIKRLWITEMNFNVPTGPTISSDAQATWLINRTNNVLARHNIERAFWYAWGHTEPWRFGLDFDTNTNAAKAIWPYLDYTK